MTTAMTTTMTTPMTMIRIAVLVLAAGAGAMAARGQTVTVTVNPPGAVTVVPAPCPPTAITILTVTVVAPTAAGTYPLPANAALFRNGLLMSPGVDYTVTLTAGEAAPIGGRWPATDTVTVLRILTTDAANKVQTP